MGVNLRDLVPKTTPKLSSLGGKSIAVDAYNALYQFLAIIRQPDGTPLKDQTGRVTSHLSGILYRTANLVEMTIKPVYVFDGTPPALKEVEIKRRTRIKEAAAIKYEKALKAGKVEEAHTYAQATSRLKDYMTEDSKRLLDYIGIPWIQAPSEGEAQAAHLARKGATNFCASQDYDSLLFGAPFLIRNLTLSGKRKLPGKKVYVEVVPEIVSLNQVLKELSLTHKQLVDIGILIGTDYNPDGIKGIGPKTALKLVKTHGSLEKIPNLEEGDFPVPPNRIRQIFLEPKVTDNYKLKWRRPNDEEVVDFLCNERDFSENRVKRALEKIDYGLRELREKTTIEQFFG
ncbi:MAG: flap endonuclease-1 [Candidatus Bathyarchaeota archaeon]|nr:MAG: flap endonuclease-1 [Candidatus Bathyarchaeota archaeon]